MSSMVAQLSLWKGNIGSTEKVHSILPAFKKLLHARSVTAALLALSHADYLTTKEAYGTFLQLLLTTSALASIIKLH